MSNRNLIRVTALVSLAVFAYFGPKLSPGDAPRTRNLSAYPPVAPLVCLGSEQAYYVNWTEIPFQEDINNQVFELENGVYIEVNVVEHENGFYEGWGKSNRGDLWLDAGTEVVSTSLIDRKGGSDPAFPTSYVTMQIQFLTGPVHGAFVSMGDIDSNNKTSDVVRIDVLDASNVSLPVTMTTTGSIKAIGNFAYEEFPEVDARFPGHGAALYAEASSGVSVTYINMDFSVFYFDASLEGRLKQRSICPALNLTFCGPPVMTSE